MIDKDELAGVAEVLGVVEEGEWPRIVREIAHAREEEPPAEEDVRGLVEAAEEEGLLAVLGQREINCDLEGERFYTVGPSAFPDVPGELSEVIDILRLDEDRRVDWDMVAQIRVADLIARITRLSSRADKLYGQATPEEVAGLEEEYGELIGLLSDYEFWLPTDLDGARESMQRLSRKIESLKELDD